MESTCRRLGVPNPMLTAAEARYPTVKWMTLVVCVNRNMYKAAACVGIISHRSYIFKIVTNFRVAKMNGNNGVL